MNEARLAPKVGLFFLLGLILLGVMLLIFSKGLGPGVRTYEIRLRAPSVAGLTPRSDVLLAGVRIGKVVSADVAEDGRTVVIRLKLERRHPVHADARFVIEQIGFLGDQYVAVYPQGNQAPVLREGDEVRCEEPFNLQEIIRSTAGLALRFDGAVSNLNGMIRRLDLMLFSEQNLTNFASTLANFRQASEEVEATVSSARQLLASNAAPVTATVSNLMSFSAELNRIAREFHATVATNREALTAALENFETTSRLLTNIVHDLEAGRGVAGSLLRDVALQQHLREAIANLDVAASNIANYGLLYRPRKAPPARR
ncbi:MAG TPA: MlaD family protein [Methylomirabilota bacterium]|nr:MlaD family protein [Methylomirabilota bacterium]